MTAPDERRALLEDPQVRENITRLSEETGIPVQRYERYLCSDPPPGISRKDWIDALGVAGRGHHRWSERMLQQLSRMATETRRGESAA